jgi:hypothetical protein
MSQPFFLPLFTRVCGRGVLRTSPFGHSRKFALKDFSEGAHNPGPMRQAFLCRVSEMRSPMYIRTRKYLPPAALWPLG